MAEIKKADVTLINFSAKAGNGGRSAVLDMEVGTHRLFILADLGKLELMHRVIADTIREMEKNQEKAGG